MRELPRTCTWRPCLPDGRVLAAGGFFASQRRDLRSRPAGPGRRPIPVCPAHGGKRNAAAERPRARRPAGWAALELTELYDYVDRHVVARARPWASARYRHSSTMLPDGRVLVAGGFNGQRHSRPRSCSTTTRRRWTAGPEHGRGRGGALAHAAEGRQGAGRRRRGTRHAPRSTTPGPGPGRRRPTTSSAQRWRHTATLLGDGQVLVAGTVASAAAGSTAELYDPATNRWSPTASMSIDRYWHTATLLPCGEVLVVGGQTGGSTILATAERYNPRTKTWRPTGEPRDRPLAAHRDAAGRRPGARDRGVRTAAALASAELYDPVDRRPGRPRRGHDRRPRYHHKATLLPNGKVLIAGGLVAASRPSSSTPPPAPSRRPGSPTSTLDIGVTATLLPNGRVLAVGGFGAARPRRASTTPRSAPGRRAWRRTRPRPPRGGAAARRPRAGRGRRPARRPRRARLRRRPRRDPGWRPVLATATDPLVRGSPLTATGSGFQGLGEGSTRSRLHALGHELPARAAPPARQRAAALAPGRARGRLERHQLPLHCRSPASRAAPRSRPSSRTASRASRAA